MIEKQIIFATTVRKSLIVSSSNRVYSHKRIEGKTEEHYDEH